LVEGICKGWRLWSISSNKKKHKMIKATILAVVLALATMVAFTNAIKLANPIKTRLYVGK